MLSLTYFSTATAPFDDAELVELMRTSRINNAVVQVTGALLFAAPYFVQTLEGEEPAVEQLFARITADTRHHGVDIAHRETVTRRNFGEWRMGFTTSDLATASRLPGFSTYLRTGRYQWPAEGSRPAAFHRIFRETVMRQAG